MSKVKLLVFSSGSAEGGGSGFEKLVDAMREGALRADIVGVVSNHENGGVRQRADKLEIPFIHFPAPWTADAYQRIAAESGAAFFALSGWLKLVTGLDLDTSFSPRTVFNIHPGPLPRFGGAGLYGHRVHKAVLKAVRDGETDYSAVSMHFVTEAYDRGPVFFEMRVPISSADSVDTVAMRVNQTEHQFQPRITHLVANRHIAWDGVNPESLRVPEGYKIVRSL